MQGLRPGRVGGAPLVSQAEVDAGLKPGVTAGEAEEIARLRKQLRAVTEERDILARAVGFFAKGTR